LDPNTNTDDDEDGVSMKDSSKIIEYLYKTYADWTPPNEILSAASLIITPLLKPVYALTAPLQAQAFAGGGFAGLAGDNENGSADENEDFDATLDLKMAEITKEVNANAVVVYTYKLSPFCFEATALLRRLDIPHTEISLGLEWVPFLINDAPKRAALGKLTKQTSLPHIFVGGTSVGGLFSGTPGMIPALEQNTFQTMVAEALLLKKEQGQQQLKEQDNKKEIQDTKNNTTKTVELKA
jgi:glutaredoxin